MSAAASSKAIALSQYKALPVGSSPSHSKTRQRHSRHGQPSQLPALMTSQKLPFFINDIEGFKSLPLGVLKIVTAYSDVLYFRDQIRRIENLFSANFTKEFIEKTFDLLPLQCSAIPGFCKAYPTIRGFSKIELRTDAILAINEVFPFITEFSGDATYLYDDHIRAFHRFEHLTDLKLDNSLNITHDGVRNIYPIKRLKQVVLNGSNFLVYKENHPTDPFRVNAFFSNDAFLIADILLEEHPCLLTFEADGLTKELAKPTDDEFEQMLSGMSTLSILPSFCQESCRNLTDRSLKLLGEKCLRLEQLLLFDCRNFTLQGIRELTKLPKLKMLSLYGCKQVDEVAASSLFPHLKSGVACKISKEKEP